MTGSTDINPANHVLARGEKEPVVEIPAERAWRHWPDSQIKAYLESEALTALDNPLPDSLLDTLDAMEQELEDREEWRAQQPDTPSLQDQGMNLGSYET
jgi:hypothetical protein